MKATNVMLMFSRRTSFQVCQTAEEVSLHLIAGVKVKKIILIFSSTFIVQETTERGNRQNSKEWNETGKFISYWGENTEKMKLII